MTTELHLLAGLRKDPAESLSATENETLLIGVAKVVAFGAQVGVSIDQMIAFLNAGLTIPELLEYLVERSGEIA